MESFLGKRQDVIAALPGIGSVRKAWLLDPNLVDTGYIDHSRSWTGSHLHDPEMTTPGEVCPIMMEGLAQLKCGELATLVFPARVCKC